MDGAHTRMDVPLRPRARGKVPRVDVAVHGSIRHRLAQRPVIHVQPEVVWLKGSVEPCPTPKVRPWLSANQKHGHSAAKHEFSSGLQLAHRRITQGKVTATPGLSPVELGIVLRALEPCVWSAMALRNLTRVQTCLVLAKAVSVVVAGLHHGCRQSRLGVRVVGNQGTGCDGSRQPLHSSEVGSVPVRARGHSATAHVVDGAIGKAAIDVAGEGGVDARVQVELDHAIHCPVEGVSVEVISLHLP